MRPYPVVSSMAALAALSSIGFCRSATALVGPTVGSICRRTGAHTAFVGASLSVTALGAAAAASTPRQPAFVQPARSYGNALRMLLGLDAFKRKEMNYDQILCPAAKEAAAWALEGKVPTKSAEGWDILTFAGGCFWGLELRFQRVPGVMATTVGYTQGELEKPTYGEVCSGSTGHTEAVQVFFDPKEVSTAELMKVFFERVDPLQVNGQGNDWGTQYRTGVYFHTPEQEAVVRKAFEEEAAKLKRPLASELLPAKVYWPAEEYHQKYLEKGGRGGNPQSAAKGATETIRCYG